MRGSYNDFVYDAGECRMTVGSDDAACCRVARHRVRRHERGARQPLRRDRQPGLPPHGATAPRYRDILLGSRRAPSVVRHRRQQRQRGILPRGGVLEASRPVERGDVQHLQHAEADAPHLRVVAVGRGDGLLRARVVQPRTATRSMSTAIARCWWTCSSRRSW